LLGKTTAFSGYYNLLGIRRGSNKDHVLREENLLTQISKSHTGKYSDKWSSYLEIYWQLFAPIRDNDVDVLEIGIQNGGSLEIWAKLFPNSKNLIGFDVHPKCKDLTFADPRIKVFVEDAAEIKAGILVRETSSNLGVVIDDGSHISRDIIRSFLIFFPQLKPGGIYVIEDLHASYWSDWQGGISHPESAMQFLKLLADVVNFDHWGIKTNRTELFDMIPATIGLLEEKIFSEIESVSFTDSVCVVRKKMPSYQGLGLRVGSGSEASVFPEVKEAAGELSPTPGQESNEFAIARDLTPFQTQSYKAKIQDLQNVNQDLENVNQDLENVNQDLESHIQKQNNEIQLLNDSINEIYATISWRVTKPIRYVRRLLSRFF
jgi:hypothetical protein